MMASSPTRVSSSWLVDAGELMDGFEFPDMFQRWKTQRGSRQKAAWVWWCSTGVLVLGFRRLAFFLGGGGAGWTGSSRFHVARGRFQKGTVESGE